MSKGSWTSLGEDKLHSSGLTTENAKALGMYEVPSAALLDPSFNAAPALVIPYRGLDGQPMAAHPRWPNFMRVRYLLQEKKAKGFKDIAEEGKEQRYAQPPRTGTCAYFPSAGADWQALAADNEAELVITEGELKASAATLAGFPTIGLGGVWNFRAMKDGVFFLPELEQIDWVQRTVYICHDSDFSEKPNICAAINSLSEELAQRGALVRVTTLPDVVEDGKTGLDDYFLHRGADDFADLLRQSDSLGVARQLWQVNDQVVYVEDPGMVVIKRTGQKMNPDMFKSHSRWATESTVAATMSAKGTVTYDKVAIAPTWIKWPLRHSVKQLTYAPGEPEITSGGDYNQWPGWAVKPTPGNVKPFTKLAEYLFADSEPGVLEYFYDWCAYPIQNPGVKLFVGVLVHGVVQGTGKSLLGYSLGEVYGKNFKEIHDADLEETYWAENKQFIMGDEVSGKDNRQYANTLKRLITQRNVDINIKFVPQYSLPNCMNFFFTSQHGDSFFLEDRDRRYLVVEVVGEPLTEKFYSEYDQWLWRDNGPSHLMDWLLKRKIDKNFNPFAPAMRTAAKERMIVATKGDLAQWVHEMMHFPDQTLRVGQSQHDRDLFTSKELLNLYTHDHPNNRVTSGGMGKALAAAGCVQVAGGAPLRDADGRMSRYFAVRNLDKWRSESDRRKFEKEINKPMKRAPK